MTLSRDLTLKKKKNLKKCQPFLKAVWVSLLLQPLLDHVTLWHCLIQPINRRNCCFLCQWTISCACIVQVLCLPLHHVRNKNKNYLNNIENKYVDNFFLNLVLYNNDTEHFGLQMPSLIAEIVVYFKEETKISGWAQIKKKDPECRFSKHPSSSDCIFCL